MVAKAKTERVKDRGAAFVDDNRLAVDYARPHREALDRGGDLRKACAEIVAIAREQPDTPLVAPGEDAEAIVLDFVNPARPRGWLLSPAGQAWFKREATMT